MTMRQYTNQSQSGTVSASIRNEVDKLQPIIERVMLIANRLAEAEKELAKTTSLVSNLTTTVETLESEIAIQDEKIRELTTASNKPVTPRPARRAPQAKSTTTN